MDPLVVERAPVLGDQHRIGEQHVVVRGARGPQVAEEQHLHRRDPFGEERASGLVGVAAQIDGDVDGQLAAGVADLVVGEMAHIEEGVDRGADPLLHRVVLHRADVERDDVEALAVVMAEDAGQQEGDGVDAEVAGDVGDADLAVGRNAGARQRRRGRRQRGPRPQPCGGLLDRRIVDESLHDERMRARLALCDAGEDACALRVEVAPVVDVQGGVQPQTELPRRVGLAREHGIQVCDRERVAVLRQVQVGAVVKRPDEARVCGDRVVEGLEREVGMAGVLVDQSLETARLGVAGRAGRDLRDDVERLAHAAGQTQQARVLEQMRRVAGREAECAFDADEGRVDRTHLLVGDAQAVKGQRVLRVERDGLLELGDGVVMPRELLERHAPVVAGGGAVREQLREAAIAGLGVGPSPGMGEAGGLDAQCGRGLGHACLLADGEVFRPLVRP
ncbi:hypothetical protein Ddc_22386 [Ditylenchus destructor]|nr:hypothetical protein Ddc_22386 [Ditylenchus destructor]